MASKRRIQRWTIAELIELVPGSSATVWKRDYLPKLVAHGALVADRGAWLGRRTEIEAALLGRLSDNGVCETVRSEGRFHSSLSWLRTLDAHATYPNAAIAIAIGATSALFSWEPSLPFLVIGAGLLAGCIAKSIEQRKLARTR